MTTTTDNRPTPAAGPSPGAPPTTSPPGRPSAPDRSMAAAAVGLALVTIGVLALLESLGVDVRLSVLGPSLLVLIGLGVVASAVRGETSGGLVGVAVLLGVLLALAVLLGSLLDVPLRGAVGEREVRPTAADLEPEYRMFVGSLVVDLRDLDLPPGTTELEVSTVVGEVEVRLPEDLPVQVEGSVAAGNASVLGIDHDGVAVDNDHRSDDWADADPRLRLTVGAGLGEVRVTRWAPTR